jgi:tetratricopeptide (TPR) repeat protein
MSPEQALARRVVIDGRTDIYSLGVTLYELLTLRPAVDGEDRAEVLRRIADREPPPPSASNPAVPRDLETVVRKAMAREPSERYATAKELADDLRRFLESRPIAARPPSLTDRVAKWARRHSTAVVTAAVFLVLVVIGLGASTLLVNRERAEAVRQRDEARRQQEFARRAVDEMYTQVAEKWLARQPKLTPLQREFLEKALAFYERFASEHTEVPAGGLAAIDAERKVGKIYEALGRHDEAQAAFGQALARCEALARRYPDDPRFRQRIGNCLGALGVIQARLSRLDAAAPLLRRAVDVHEGLAARHPEDVSYRRDLAGSLINLGIVFKEQGRLAEAEASLRRGREIYEAIVEKSDDQVARRNLAQAESNLGNLLRRTGRPREAEEALHRAIRLEESLLAADPTDPGGRLSLAKAVSNLGVVQAVARRSEEAAASFRRSESMLEALVRDFPDRPEYLHDLSMAHLNLAQCLEDSERKEEAAQALRRALKAAERLTKDYPSVADYRKPLAMYLVKLAGLEIRDQPGEAETHYRQALGIAERLAADFPGVASYRDLLAEVLQSEAQFYSETAGGGPRDPVQALELARRAVDIGADTQLCWKWLGLAEYANGHWDTAIQATEKSIAIRGDQGWSFLWLVLALAHARRGELDEARTWYAKVEKRTADVTGWGDTPRWLIDEGARLLGGREPAPLGDSVPTPKAGTASN